MSDSTRQRPRVDAQALLRRLPRRQRDLIEAASILGERRKVSVYLVGGPVRDIILGRPSSDLDLAVTGDALVYAKALAARVSAQVTTHPQFGTATLVLRDGIRLDVATARRESYARPAALPAVVPGTLEEDLFRRDFTINAMAIRLARDGKKFLDPFGGLKDLKKRLLRTLHEQSYRDDPTRIFRGARYAARFRLRFSRSDRRQIRSVLAEGVLKRLSTDRLFREVKLVLGEPRAEAILKALENLGVLLSLDPALALAPNTAALMRRVRKAWERYHHFRIAPEPHLWRSNLMILLLSMHAKVRQRVGEHLGIKGPPLEVLMIELGEVPALREKLDQRNLAASGVRHLLDGISGDVRLVAWATGGRRVRQRVEQYFTHLASVRPALTGQDLRRFGFPPGPIYGRILALLLEGRLEGRLTSRDAEIAFLRERFGRPR